jgi:hypothetical protein
MVRKPNGARLTSDAALLVLGGPGCWFTTISFVGRSAGVGESFDDEGATRRLLLRVAHLAGWGSVISRIGAHIVVPPHDRSGAVPLVGVSAFGGKRKVWRRDCPGRPSCVLEWGGA